MSCTSFFVSSTRGCGFDPHSFLSSARGCGFYPHFLLFSVRGLGLIFTFSSLVQEVVGLILGLVISETLKFVFTASTQSMWCIRGIVRTGCFGVEIICAYLVTCLPTSCCIFFLQGSSLHFFTYLLILFVPDRT